MQLTRQSLALPGMPLLTMLASDSLFPNGATARWYGCSQPRCYPYMQISSFRVTPLALAEVRR